MFGSVTYGPNNNKIVKLMNSTKERKTSFKADAASSEQDSDNVNIGKEQKKVRNLYKAQQTDYWFFHYLWYAIISKMTGFVHQNSVCVSSCKTFEK